jgi:autotransporter strand-loop-strand O-heptosyltransferase
MNNLFQDKYPEIEFVAPGKTIHNLYAMYRIGWYYDQNNQVDYNYHLRDFREHPLAESACDILGLSYVQNRPRILNVNVHRPIEKEYVCIAIHATAQAKYWNNPQGWSDVVKFLKEKGYEVILLSKEGLYFMGNNAPEMVKHIPEGPITNIINYLQHAKLFIGVGSGLTWLSWAVGCQTCLISGFSYPYTEFDECTRIYSDDLEVCSGCFNRYKLDMEDWNWCPDQKNTPRMFECTKSITSQKVILAIKDLL